MKEEKDKCQTIKNAGIKKFQTFLNTKKEHTIWSLQALSLSFHSENYLPLSFKIFLSSHYLSPILGT